MPMKISCLSLIALMFTVGIMAQEEVPEMSSDRPDAAESPSVLSYKAFQIETGFGIFGSEDDDIKVKGIQYNTTLLRYGLFENAELRFEMNYDAFDQEIANMDSSYSGFSPFTVGTKVGVYEGNGIIPELGLLVSFGLPNTGHKDFYLAFLAPEIILAASNEISERVELEYNIGMEWDGFSARASGIYAAALGLELSDKIGLFGELYGEFAEEVDTELSFDAGLVYLLQPNIQLDISGGSGLNEAAKGYFAAVGITWRLPR